ncbi:MAG: glucose-1-phosphate adenylyltransferase subunit GlgD [Anaerovoracaceae bacterium]
MYRGIIDALDQNMNSIKRSMGDYVILSGSNIICTIDFQELLKKHIESQSDITAVYTKTLNGSQIIPSGVAVLDLDNSERLTGLTINQDDINPRDANWSLGIFVMKKSLLESLVADACSFERYNFYIDIIQRLSNNLKIMGYEYKGHILDISSVENYMKANMSLLSGEFRNKVFSEPIYTKIKDSVPALYCPGCTVSNSIISDGCIIEGTVINSVLSRGVKVGKGSMVKNCIVMQDTEIMRDTFLDNVILDKDIIVRDNRHLSGHEAYPVVIEKLSIL